MIAVTTGVKGCIMEALVREVWSSPQEEHFCVVNIPRPDAMNLDKFCFSRTSNGFVGNLSMVATTELRSILS
jgi:hypothetical protein